MTTRRSFLTNTAQLAGLASLGASVPGLNLFAAEDGAATTKVVTTGSGKVRGKVIAGVNAFKGIPYGAPTGGKNRFMPPGKPAAWTGTRDALAYGPTAPQAGDNSGTTASSQSEDCLLLNVFTPGLKDGRKRPVIVWLHGGGFSTGSGRIIDGTSLAGTHDTVVVVPLLIRWCRLGQRVGAREDNHHRQRGK